MGQDIYLLLPFFTYGKRNTRESSKKSVFKHSLVVYVLYAMIVLEVYQFTKVTSKQVDPYVLYPCCLAEWSMP